LSAGDFDGACDFGNAAEIVSKVGVHWADALVDRERHRGEELKAIGFPFGAEAHHPIVEAVGALAWGEIRDVWCATWLGASAGWRKGGRLRGSSGGASAAKALSGDECNQGEQSDGGDCPG
jgi:hypothetical protein